MKDNIGCIGTILIIIVIAVVFNFIKENINAILIVFASLAVIAFIIYIIGENNKTRKINAAKKEEENREIAYQKEQDELETAILKQVNEIINNNKTYIDKFVLIAEPKVYRLDEYGDETEDHDALNNEVEIVLMKIISKEQIVDFAETINYWLKDYLVRHLRNCHHFYVKHHERSTVLLPDFANMTGSEFEGYVSNFLEAKGYTVAMTGKTGDQGADLIVQKEGKKIIVQAKCYSGSVGNKAVQEVISALKFYDGDEGWVITNSYFTKSAEELARKCNITLINGARLQKELPTKNDNDNLESIALDPLIKRAATAFVSEKEASASRLFQLFGIDYLRAGLILDQLESLNIIGPYDGTNPRKVLIFSLDELHIYFKNVIEPSASRNDVS